MDNRRVQFLRSPDVKTRRHAAAMRAVATTTLAACCVHAVDDEGTAGQRGQLPGGHRDGRRRRGGDGGRAGGQTGDQRTRRRHRPCRRRARQSVRHTIINVVSAHKLTALRGASRGFICSRRQGAWRRRPSKKRSKSRRSKNKPPPSTVSAPSSTNGSPESLKDSGVTMGLVGRVHGAAEFLEKNCTRG